uniref:Centromere protein X n=1 Tax=Anas platyrhynchos TaxID=8839 RepID=A0A8B9SID8_ANAPL
PPEKEESGFGGTGRGRHRAGAAPGGGGTGRGRHRAGAAPGGSAAVLSPQDTVERLLRLHFRDDRTRVNGDALRLTAELLKVFVREAAARAARQAQAEDVENVNIEHVEKVLPQLVRNWSPNALQQGRDVD